MSLRSKGILRGGAAALGVSALVLGGAAASASAAARPVHPVAATSLTGAGSTFIAPLMQGAIIPGYTKLHPNVQVNYQAIGSGAGISLFTKGSTDFAGSDALLSATQENLARAQCGGGVSGGVFKIPVTIGAIAIIFNLQGVSSGLKLSPAVLSNIFLGKITGWNDPAIKALNPGVNLPSLAIQTVHRADGSGTSYIFTHYLSDVSPAWKTSVGSGTTVLWPNGTGAKGSSGVSAAVGQTNGTISYVDLAYATANKLSTATLQNASGKYVAPSSASATAAADSFASTMPADLQQLIVNSKAAAAYPVTGYSYVFMCTRQNSAHGQTLVDFVHYAVTAGQASAASLFYGSLPKNVQALDVAALAKITRK